MNIIGIDPGLKGALASLGHDRYPIHILPMPLLASGDYDWLAISAWLYERKPALACIEKLHGRPHQRIQSTWTQARGYGGLLATVAMAGLAIELITPQRWQGDVLADMDRTDTKAASIAYCARAFPGVVPVNRNGRGHDGVADALCLAEYGRRHFVRAGT